MSGSLRLRFGPMFSGKTTWLDGELNEFARNGWSCLKIVHANDKKRFIDASVDDTTLKSSGYTHNLQAKALDPRITVVFTDTLVACAIDMYNIIAIDEAQFFPDLLATVKVWVTTKHLLVVGLDGNSQKERFGAVLDLIPLADEACKVVAKCGYCMTELKEDQRFHGSLLNLPAPFSKRLAADQTEILVGGADKYVATCRFHHG